MGPMDILSGAQALGGLIQTGVGLIGARKARKQLEGLQTPTYTPAKSISDYYNQALNRYQQSPQQSNLYKMQAQNIARGTAQGIAGLQGRRSALGGISGLIQGQNDAQLKALAAAEQDQNQKFSQLGSASQAMGAEERQAFNINKMMPYEKQYNLLAMKAQANNQMTNAGLQNIYGAGQSYLMGKSLSETKSSDTLPDYSKYEYGNPKSSTYKVPLAKYGG
jgi:hypothetical protein